MHPVVHLLLLLGLIWGPLGGVSAQTPLPDSLRSVEREVTTRLRQHPSDPVRVVQVRELLREQVPHGNVQQLPRLLAYLRQTTADTTAGVRPYEEWALLMAAGDVYAVADKLRRFGEMPTSAEQTRRYQALPQDGLFELTTQRVAQRQDTLRNLIRQAHFLPEDSTFLQLFVELLVPLPPADTAADKARNTRLLAFLGRYPASEYAYFIQQFARPEYAPSRFSYGLDFHSGSGVLLGNMGTYFRHGANFGVGFELGWDRYQLYLRDYIGLGSVRQPLEYRGSWRPGLKVNYVVPEVSVGYRVVDGRRLRVVPFVGLSALLVGPGSTRKDDPDSKLDLTFRQPFTAGLNLDVPLWRTASGAEVGSWLLKLRAGVRGVGPARHDDALRGGILYLDLGIGGFGRLLRPKKP